MPLPAARKGQSQKAFISACMSSEVMKREFPEQKQRVAVCYSRWRKKHGGNPPAKSEAAARKNYARRAKKVGYI